MPSPSADAPRSPLSILVVDDEPDMEAMVRQMFRSRVRRGHYRLAFAGNGREALAYVDSGAGVDVVVTDINMPSMNGIELLEALQARGCDAKSVVVSAYGDMGNIRAAMNFGAFDFITKPVDFDDLQSTIERTQRCVSSCRASGAASSPDPGVLDGAAVRAVQRAILPDRVSWDRRYTVSAALVAAGAFGGDFVDVVRLEDECVGLVAGRVSTGAGDGMLAMLQLRSLFKGAAIADRDPGSVLSHVGEAVRDGALGSASASALYAVHCPIEHTVACVAAGEVGALVLSPFASGSLFPDGASAPLGRDMDTVPHFVSADVRPGRVFVASSRSCAGAGVGAVPDFGDASSIAASVAGSSRDVACLVLSRLDASNGVDLHG